MPLPLSLSSQVVVAKASEVQREVGEELEHVVSEAAEVDSRRNSLFGEKRTKEKAIRDTQVRTADGWVWPYCLRNT